MLLHYCSVTAIISGQLGWMAARVSVESVALLYLHALGLLGLGLSEVGVKGQLSVGIRLVIFSPFGEKITSLRVWPWAPSRKRKSYFRSLSDPWRGWENLKWSI